MRPGPLAHHTSVLYDHGMYVYGGTDSSRENAGLYRLDMRSFMWSIVSNSQVVARDGHSACFSKISQSLVVFGGFKGGERTNEVMTFNIKAKSWQTIKCAGK